MSCDCAPRQAVFVFLPTAICHQNFWKITLQENNSGGHDSEYADDYHLWYMQNYSGHKLISPQFCGIAR
jgi:hypothetical protein